MDFIARRGTLLIASGPSRDPARKHLFVVCTEPDQSGTQILLSICSVPVDAAKSFDDACILHRHDHPFLRHDSYVLYAKPEYLHARSIVADVRARNSIQREDLNQSAFLRVTKGACRSRRAPPRLKADLGC